MHLVLHLEFCVLNILLVKRFMKRGSFDDPLIILGILLGALGTFYIVLALIMVRWCPNFARSMFGVPHKKEASSNANNRAES